MHTEVVKNLILKLLRHVGQSGRSVGIRHKEHTRYIKTNNPVSAYALHILNNRQEYENAEHTTEPLKPCNKGIKMNCWESFFMHILQKQNVFSNKQKVNDLNPLYDLAQDITLRNYIPTSSFSLLLTSVHVHMHARTHAHAHTHTHTTRISPSKQSK
jgi:hypothetical protein